MIINTNMSALIAESNLSNTQSAMASDVQKLSSGLRINSAADDAAGLAISEKMKAQINGLTQAQRNSQDGISMLQTAEGGMSQVQSILQRMRELAVQSASDTNTSSDRTQISTEFKQLQSEIGRIAGATQFNTKDLINGAGATGIAFTIQVGANKDQVIGFSISGVGATSLGVNNTQAAVANQSVAASAISTIDAAINSISTDRDKLGALQNRFQYAINNLGTSLLNITSAQSQIADVDMATQMSDFTKNQILSQAGTSMLAQANQMNQSILKLFP